MSLVNCSDGPPSLDTPCTDVERLYASVLCMVDELARASLPSDLNGAIRDKACRALHGFSRTLLTWIERQEDAPRG